ncbi:MAG: TadE/TadG family type IV pilus assembly protein [Planctomycetota bacterium]|nr:TadE/TadG family type IV pilus assembly protein [Planctomycetota bacterium]
MFRKKLNKRSGVEVVEVAITVPILFAVTMATIDVCNYFHLKQKANSVAYETARTASLEGETFQSARQAGVNFSDARKMSNYTIQVSAQADLYDKRDLMPKGARINAVVELPVKGNEPGLFLLFQTSTIRSQEYVISAR